MAQILVRRLDDDVKRRLAARAKLHGRSLEAEARTILLEAVAKQPPGQVAVKPEAKGFGTRMAEAFKDVGLTDEEHKLLDREIARMRRKKWRVVKFEE